MKKYLSLIAFAMMAVVSLSLTGCGSDDDDDVSTGSSELVGTWDMQTITSYYAGESPEVENPVDAYWVFTADKLTVHDKTDLANGQSVNYTYNSSSKELSIVGYPLYTVTELTKSTLVIRSQEIYGGYDVIKFKKR
ncbi:MAG: lipocalin family protein [Bacteroidaceae bacterium]|nr:lipocalin family protein [Bacteroidaceae bacterium]